MRTATHSGWVSTVLITRIFNMEGVFTLATINRPAKQTIVMSEFRMAFFSESNAAV